MSKWFRFYDEVLDDPKVQTLPPEMFKAWVNLLCLAARNQGKLPTVEACAFALRISVHGCSTVLSRLADGGLLDSRQGGATGAHYAIHGWDKRQYKSDTSTGRVKRFRERFKTVTETAPDTETDTDTETERKEGGASADEIVFEGKVIRLKAKDYERWKSAYHAIPDFMSALSVADDYYAVNPPPQGKWFFPVSRWLEKEHQKASEATKRYDARMDPAMRGVDCRPLTPEERAYALANGLS